MRRYQVVVLNLLFISLLSACGNQLKQPIFGPSWYQIKSYDTLYSIAWRYGLDVNDLARWNNIESPGRIRPGQKILLYQPPQVAQIATKPRTLSKPNKKVIPVTVSGLRPDRVKLSGKPFDHWPTAGKVSHYFSTKSIDRKGIDISGNLGQAVYAVAKGKIVYSGNGLLGYGNLIIIKHSETFLSAYAHNKKRLVSEGAQVTRGKKIATMGQDDDGKVLLHFQIRKYGKPVNPLKYLPKNNNLLKQ